MENIYIPPFYVGQEIVAIEMHGRLNKGDEFIVESISNSGECGCKSWIVTIGIHSPQSHYQVCGYCGKEIIRLNGGTLTFLAKRFAPKIEGTRTYISKLKPKNI